MACSLASRLALIESRLPHQVVIVNTARGEQKTEAYMHINPRGKVPALETDDGVLTESAAILAYISDLVPAKGLLPAPGTFARAQGQSWLAFLSSTLHPAFRAVVFPVEGCDGDVARQASFARLVAAYQDADRCLEGREHVLDAFGMCDLYMLVFALWRMAPGLQGKLPALPNLDRLQAGLLARPGLAAVVSEDMKLRTAG
jgi:glutathione S-transferase